MLIYPPVIALFNFCIVIGKSKEITMIYLDNTTDEQDIYIPIDRRVDLGDTIDSENNNE